MATLHLMVGLPGSGKTTCAKQLEKEYHALRFTTDEWHIHLYGHDFYNDPSKDEEHNIRHAKVEDLIWEVAKKALLLDINVILDFGCWAKEERDDLRQRAHELGADFKIHYMPASKETLLKNLEKRHQEQDENSFYINKASIDKWYDLFEVPTKEELEES